MRNESTLTAIATELERNCGDDLAACRAVGVSLQFLNQWRKDDKKTNEVILEATRVGVQGLYSAAVQRGVHGIEEDVWYKGDVVGQKTVYSDGLLGKLLEAKLADFKKADPGAPVQVQVNVANLMPRATSYDEWLAMKDGTLKSLANINAAEAGQRDNSLAALGRVMCEPAIDVEFTEVTPRNVFEGIEL